MRFGLSLVLLAVSLPNCKPPAGGSEVQSLENFSAGTLLRKNVCFGDRETLEPRDMLDFPVIVNASSDKAEALENVARSSLSAIPYDMKTMVMMAGGKILITRDAPKLCGKDRLKSGSDSGSFSKFASCFLDIKTKNSPASGLTIVISDNAAYVNHILVRTFAYALSQKFAWQFMTSKSNGQLTDVNPFEYDDLRDDVVAAYLQDMATSKIFSLEKLERLLGQDAAKIIARNQKQLNGRDLDQLFGKLTWSNEQGMQLTRSLAPTIGDAFKDFVVGEAFDSYHCDAHGAYDKNIATQIKGPSNLALFAKLKNSRKVMQDFFPRTFAAYQKMDDHFLRLGRAARNSLAVVSGGSTLGQPETSGSKASKRSAGRSSNHSARGLSLTDDAASGFALAEPTTSQAQRDAWDAAARRSPTYKAAQQRISDLQQKKGEAWVGGGYRYDESIQQAQFDAQKAWRAEFQRAESSATKRPVVDHYKPQEFVTQREAFNKSLDEQLAKTQKAVNDKFAEGAAAGAQFKEELITYSRNTSSPTMAALAAGGGELIGGVGQVSTKISQGVNNGFHAAAKGVVNTGQGAYDTAQGTSEFIHDASIIYRETDGDLLDKAAAVSQATTDLAGKKIVQAGDATVAEFDRMKSAYNEASGKISAAAVASVEGGANPYAAAADAVGRNLSSVGTILPGPMQGVAPFGMLENTYVGGEALVRGDYERSRDAFGDVLVEGGTDILTDKAKETMNGVAYDTYTSKSGPFADARRDSAAFAIKTQNQLGDISNNFESAVVGGAGKDSTETWLRQGAFDVADKFNPGIPSGGGGLLETYRDNSPSPASNSQPSTQQPTNSSPQPANQPAMSEPTAPVSQPVNEPTFE